MNIEKLDPKKFILIKGASLHNLKNLDIAIPRDKMVVITGLSGSGKSTLAFDTLYAEGQRRYVESLSSYARQFLGRLNKPKVDYIKGISPAIAIEQKVNTSNSRSTVGSITEIYDYLKLLYARISKAYSPVTGKEVKKHSVKDVLELVNTFEDNTRLLLTAPINLDDRDADRVKTLCLEQGYVRIFYRGEIHRLDKITHIEDHFELIIDRVVVSKEEDFRNRLVDSIEMAFYEGRGICLIRDINNKKSYHFSNKFEADGIKFPEANTHFFSYNNPYGACPKCEGHGSIIDIDDSLVIPHVHKSIFDNAIAPWRGASYSKYKEQFITNAHKFDFPIHKPWLELSQKEKDLLWEGNTHFVGLNDFFKSIERETYKIQNRYFLSRYRGKSTCKHCKGTRLRKETSYFKIQGTTLNDLIGKPVNELIHFFDHLHLSPYEEKVSRRLMVEIKNRLSFVSNVGLEYLTLNRPSNTLSGGESQRINLAKSLGSSLIGSLYILDEPTIGLHPKDNERLICVLKGLKDLGNTVIIVEHDEDIMKTADCIFDIGPGAGSLGGELVAQGNLEHLSKSDSLTAQYLNGKLSIEVPKKRRTSSHYIQINGATAHNLKNIDVHIPLNVLTAITGVSGSGKSTLIKKILYPALKKRLEEYSEKPLSYKNLTGSFNHLRGVEYVDQNPMGKTSRSNPVTYLKVYDDIRSLMAKQKMVRKKDLTASHFSFNTGGGRCEVCNGEGKVTIDMQFMADISLICEACNGKRFKKDILDIRFNTKNISDILEMTIDDAIVFFQEHQEHKISEKLKVLQDVGMGYITLGQSSSTLSGGEAQRIKLATFLIKGKTQQPKLFIFDEPTTGLHLHDIKKLIKAFESLIAVGHSVLVIEHHLDLIKSADYIIDLGPQGGEKGGYLVADGPPETLVQNKQSITGKYLKSKL